MAIQSEEKRQANMGELSRLAILGLEMGAAYIGLKPLLSAEPWSMEEGFSGAVIDDAFPLVDGISWPIVAGGLAFGALIWEGIRKVPKRVGIPKIKRGSWQVPIGKTYRGKWIYHDFSGSVPHALDAGSTKFGKTTFMQMVTYVLCQQQPPEKLQIVFIDLKGGASFGKFKHLPHVLDVKRTVEEAEQVLEEVEAEMWRRLDEIDKAQMAFREVPEFPRLFVFIDEGSLLKLSDKAMKHLQNITAIGRQPHTHIVYGTQRPSYDVLPVTIRDQLEGRFVFHLNESGSSSVALGDGNKSAYEMPAKPGRMIYRCPDGEFYLQATYVPDEVIDAWLKEQAGLYDVPGEDVEDEGDKVDDVGGLPSTLSAYDTTAFKEA